MASREFPHRKGRLFELLLSGSILIECAAIVYLLMILDNLVNGELYQFGLQFSYDWAYQYWTLLRMTLALAGLIAGAASITIAFSYWAGLRKPVLMTEIAKKTVEAEATLHEQGPVFQCTSCQQKTTNPLRITIYTCPDCEAPMVPASYAHAGAQLADLQLDKLKEVVRRYLKAGILTLDDLTL